MLLNWLHRHGEREIEKDHERNDVPVPVGLPRSYDDRFGCAMDLRKVV